MADDTEAYAVLGLMGPDSARIAADCGAPELDRLGFFRHGEARIAGRPVRAARLSYVGEKGWEITCRAADADAVYGAMHDAGASPAGLHAQTAMRIEKRFLAYGERWVYLYCTPSYTHGSEQEKASLNCATDDFPCRIWIGFGRSWNRELKRANKSSGSGVSNSARTRFADTLKPFGKDRGEFGSVLNQLLVTNQSEIC